jgi:hypothetical protein
VPFALGDQLQHAREVLRRPIFYDQIALLVLALTRASPTRDSDHRRGIFVQEVALTHLRTLRERATRIQSHRNESHQGRLNPRIRSVAYA